MSVTTRKKDLVLPKAHDIALAEHALRSMSKFMSRDGKKDIQFTLCRTDSKKVIEFALTPIAVELLFRMVVHMAKGDAITLVPFHAELTTQEAALFLNVSRPYLIKLLEQKAIPYRTVGRHRRVLFKDLVHYKEQAREKALKACDLLTREAQELDLGY